MLDQLDIKGIVVRLGPAWRAMLQGRSYAPAVVRALGEMTAVTVAIAGQMKSDSRLSFQLKGSGPIQRLFIDCDASLKLRGMATADLRVPDVVASELIGHGQMVMTLDLPESSQPFQSVVPIVGHTIASIFEHYIGQSEQLETRLVLAADDHHAAALLVQKMPDTDLKDADGWTRVLHLLSTVNADELRELAPEILLSRVFHEEDVRVFTPREVRYHCPEDWPKIHRLLRALGHNELQAILDEHGEIVVRDDVCNHEYRLEPSDVETLLAIDPGKPTLH